MTRTVRLKHLCSRWGEYGLGVSPQDYASEGVRLIRTSDITDDGRLAPPEEGVFVDPAAVDGLELRTGDVLISRSGTVGRSLVFDEEKHGSCTFAAYLVRFRLREPFDSRFVYYFTKSSPFEQQVALDATQATIANFNAQKLGDLQLPDVSPEEQTNTAEFLDGETARIDGLTHAKKRLLGLLQELWRDEVVKTVTQGLSNDEFVPVDSPWFGRLPATWRLESLKRRWDVIDCKHHTPVYIDQGYPLVSHGEIEEGRVYPGRSGRFVKEADYLNLIEGRRPKRGDIVYTRNAAIGNAGTLTPTKTSRWDRTCASSLPTVKISGSLPTS